MKKLFTVIIIFSTFSNIFAGDSLKGAIKISASGMKAQEARLRIVAQNIANKDSVSLTPGGNPYRRQTIILNAKNDRNISGSKVIIKKISKDKSAFKKAYDPNHPAADDMGYIKYPNVDIYIENADSKDAAKTYEANLNMLDLSKNIYNKTLEILK